MKNDTLLCSTCLQIKNNLIPPRFWSLQNQLYQTELVGISHFLPLSHTVGEKSWPTLTYKGFFQFIEVGRHLFMHSSLKALPQHFIWAEVWTLTASLRHAP